MLSSTNDASDETQVTSSLSCWGRQERGAPAGSQAPQLQA